MNKPYSAELLSSSWLIEPGKTTEITVQITNHEQHPLTLAMTISGIPPEWLLSPPEKITVPAGEQMNLAILGQAPNELGRLAGRYRVRIELQEGQAGPKTELEGYLTFKAPMVEWHISIMMDLVKFSAAPETQISVPLTIVNKGFEPEIVIISVKDLPPGWVSIASPRVQIKGLEKKPIILKIQPKLSDKLNAGRTPFRIQIKSEQVPENRTSADCTLTLEAHSAFESTLKKVEVPLNENVEVVVENLGNIPEAFTTSWTTGNSVLTLEEIKHQRIGKPSSTTPSEGYQNLRLSPGEKGIYVFQTRIKRPPIFADEVAWPFDISITSSNDETQTRSGHVIGRGVFPQWVLLAITLFLVGAMCILGSLIYQGISTRAGATQAGLAFLQAPTLTAEAATANAISNTQQASFYMTQAVEQGERDDDGDGLTNREEVERGTDPLAPDTDLDGLSDRNEVDSGTDPLNPDSDGDGLTDGEEVNIGSNPLNQDTDGDGLTDGQEVERGTNPLNQDTDNDGLLDNVEVPPCPDPLDPDSDDDGTVDSKDLNPCDALNPDLTATANVSILTETPAASSTPEATAGSTILPATATTAPPTVPPPPPLPQIPGIILFESRRDGNPEIYAYNTANQQLSRLTNNAAEDTAPVWAPDRSQFAFVSNRDGNFEIYAVNVDGSNLRNLTNNPADDLDPAWSPNGSQIAFTTDRDSNKEIYLMNADGSNPVNLTQNGATDSQPTWFMAEGSLPGFPLIAFTTDRDGNQEIYSMTSEGLESTNLTQHPNNDFFPAGSPVDNLLTFTTDRDGNLEVYQMRASGENPINLTANPAADQHPAWSGNGDWIAFSSNRDGNDEIYILEIGGEVYRLTNHPEADRYPAW